MDSAKDKVPNDLDDVVGHRALDDDSAANRRPPWYGAEGGWNAVAEAGMGMAGSAPLSLPVAVSKAGQLEAETLDQELTDMLKDQLRRVFSLLRPSAMLSFGPELDALFRCVIFSYSVWQNKPTPGNMFQNLVYSDDSKGTDPSRPLPKPLTRKQRALHGILHVLLPWVWARAGHALSLWGWGALGEDDWRRRAWLWYQRAEATHRHLSLGNFLLFLLDGKYRTLPDRLLSMRLLHADPSMTRSLNLEYVGHFLAWQSFMQLLNFLRPIVSRNAAGVRRHIMAATGLGVHMTRAADQPPEGACQVCGASPANSPHAPACGHVHCYYCLRANMLAQPGAFVCRRCNRTATVCAPVRQAADTDQ